jgi:hypothetical protein
MKCVDNTTIAAIRGNGCGRIARYFTLSNLLFLPLLRAGKMFSHLFFRFMALSVIVVTLCGCAEIDRRGGVVADIEDYVLFTAHTKSHRLFRSYMLIGVLVAAARQGGHNEVDREAIGGNLKAALSVAYEAYACLYYDKNTVPDWIKASVEEIGKLGAVGFSPPKICQFFDEKMARLDYALFRLALSTLFNEKSNTQLANIRDKLIGEIPVVSASAKAAIFGVRAANQVTTIVDDLLSLSFSSAGPVLTLLPLYRDALEMNMWVIVDSLTRACDVSETDLAKVNLVSAPPVPDQFGMDCATRDYALYILGQGNGNLVDWRNFVRRMNYVGNSIDAYQPHFVLVTRLIWRSCRRLLREDDCKKLIEDTVALATRESIEVVVNERHRSYSASVRAPSQFAKGRLAPPPDRAPAAVSNPRRDPESTGSIPSRSGASSQSPAQGKY